VLGTLFDAERDGRHDTWALRVPQRVSFGTNAGCPEIKAFNVSRVDLKIEAK
jgi:hypothetical protein